MREPGFFAIKIREHFEFRRRWYHEPQVRGLVLAYYFGLRSVLKANPHLRKYVARCRDCGIFILIDPRNVRPEQEEDKHKPARDKRRKGIGCRFGCREAHRKKRAAERSAGYYGGPVGKAKKKLHNGKRSKKAKKSEPTEKSEPADEGSSASDKNPEANERKARHDDIEFDPEIVTYVRTVTSLIEGRPVSRDEIVQMLKRAMSHRSIRGERRIDYIVRSLKEKPP